MANNKIVGPLGLTIPVINPSDGKKKSMTSEEVIKWRASLPMADTGTAAKRLFIALSELNHTELNPVQRFEIIELFRTTTKAITSTLKRHYTEQTSPLNQQKLTIANLRQTLLSEMADNYKLIVEDLFAKTDRTEAENTVLATSIARILYYYNVILLCCYQLYSLVPAGLWKEIHLLYKYSKTNNLLNIHVSCELSFNKQTTIISSYTRIIVLSAADPYQWRQKEQYSINKAIDLWAVYPTIYSSEQIPSKKIGIYIIDLNKDAAPIAFSFINDPITPSCIAIDLAKNVKHLKHVLLKMHNNEAENKIRHAGDPEFSVTIPTLNKLVKVWSQQITRNAQRFPITATIKVAFGLIAAHYYLNGQKEFNARPHNLASSSAQIGGGNRAALDLPTFEIEDDEDEAESAEDSAAQLKRQLLENNIKTQAPAVVSALENPELIEAEKTNLLTVYDYNIENISPNGFGILIDDGTFPPFQAGEIMIFKNPNQTDSSPWSIGTVRWIRSPRPKVFQIGIELVAPQAKAAGLQMMRNNEPVGYLLRCLVIPEAQEINAPSMIITPTMPLRSNKVILYVDNADGFKTTLIKEVDATGTYHQYIYSAKENAVVIETKVEEKEAEVGILSGHGEKTNTEFDDIWGDL